MTQLAARIVFRDYPKEKLVLVLSEERAIWNYARADRSGNRYFACIAEGDPLIIVQQGMGVRDVIGVGRVVTKARVIPESASTPMWAFMPKCHWLPVLAWRISGSRSPLWFLVEDGAAMIVASTTMPSRSLGPFLAGRVLMATKMRSVSLFSSCRRWSLSRVVAPVPALATGRYPVWGGPCRRQSSSCHAPVEVMAQPSRAPVSGSLNRTSRIAS